MRLKYIIFRVRVSGESLWPELIPGRRYWATNLLPPKVGDYVVFANPDDRKQNIIKKLRLVKDGNYILRGTVPWSISYHVPAAFFLGKLIARV